jgi:hypothetical protein
VSSFVYDAAVLIAAERNDRRVWADHKARLELALVPLVPATVVAEVSRSPRQVQLIRFLRGCEIVALDARTAHAAGRLLGKTKTANVVDATVVALAVSRSASILTSDPDDLSRLVQASGSGVAVIEV